MSNLLSFGAGTHTGVVGSNNEDCFLAKPDIGLWLVADGVGGHEAGEIASHIVKDAVAEAISKGENLHDAIHFSHNALKDAVLNDIGSLNMGTTVVALLTQENRYQISWVGDSRAYLWNQNELTLKQLSKDHSYVQSLFDSGLINAEEMENHAQKNIITQSLSPSEDSQISVDTVVGQWTEDEKILLCSDGLSDLVKDSEIRNILIKNRDQEDQYLVDLLIKTALIHGGTDNVSVELVSGPIQHKGLQKALAHKQKPIIFGLSLSVISLMIYLVLN